MFLCWVRNFFCPIRPGLEAVPGIVLTAQALQHFSDAQLRAKSKSSNLVEPQCGSFPKLGVPYLGVLIIIIII